MPVDSVNFHSRAFTTPFATTGDVSQAQMNSAFPHQNSPWMPNGYAGAAGGSENSAELCARQCLMGAGVKAAMNGKGSNRKEMAEGCLEGCGIKNPDGPISTLLTQFVSGDSLGSVGVNAAAMLGMMGIPGHGAAPGTTLAHESCYQMTVAGLQDTATTDVANSGLMACNNFGAINDMSLPHQACIMGVMSAITAPKEETARESLLNGIGSAECKESKACSIRKCLRSCDPILFAGENQNVAAAAANTQRAAAANPGLFAGQHAACYTASLISVQSKKGTIGEFNTKFQGCQSGGFGSPAMPHHSCVTGVMSVIGLQPSETLSEDIASVIKRCDSFLGIGTMGYTGLGYTHGQYSAYGMPGPLSHMLCYQTAMASSDKPEETSKKLEACGALAVGNPMATQHQACVMEKIKAAEGKQEPPELSSCDHFMFTSFGYFPPPGVLPSVHPGVLPFVHPGVLPSVHPGVLPSVYPGVPSMPASYHHGALHCYHATVMGISETTAKETLASQLASCQTGAQHQACISRQLMAASNGLVLKTALSMCDPMLHHYNFQGMMGSNHHQTCYNTIMGQLDVKNLETLPSRLATCGLMTAGNPGLAAHQTCVMGMLKQQGPGATNVQDIKAVLAKCDATLLSGGLYSHGNGHLSMHSHCIASSFAKIGSQSKPEELVSAIQGCAAMQGESPVATAYQQCLQSAVQASESQNVIEVKNKIESKCQPVLGQAIALTPYGPNNFNVLNAASLSGMPYLQAAAAAGFNGHASPLAHQNCYTVTISTAHPDMTRDELASKLNLCGAFATPGASSPYGATAISHQACITSVLQNPKLGDEKAGVIIKELLKLCDPLMYPGAASLDHIHIPNGEKMPFIPEGATDLPLLHPTYAVAPMSVHPTKIHPALGDIPPLLEAILTQKEPKGGLEKAAVSPYAPGPMLAKHTELHTLQAVVHPAAPVHVVTAHNHYSPQYLAPAGHMQHSLLHFKQAKVGGSPLSVKLDKEARALGIGTAPTPPHRVKTAAKPPTTVPKAKEAAPLRAANPVLEMMQTPTEVKENALFDRIASSGKANTPKLRGGRKLLAKVSGTPSTFGFDVSTLSKFYGNPQGGVDSGKSYRVRDNNRGTENHELTNILDRNSLRGGEPIAARPMAMAPAFVIGNPERIGLSSSKHDGAEPLVPDGPTRTFAGNNVAESHIQCMLRCHRNANEMTLAGFHTTTKENDMAICLQDCLKFAERLYPVKATPETSPPRADASLMAPRGAASANRPIRYGANQFRLKYPGMRSWESAMNYLSSTAPVMSPISGEP
jgi:hypothetical protein